MSFLVLKLASFITSLFLYVYLTELSNKSEVNTIKQENEMQFEILEKLCATTFDDRHHFLILQAQDHETKEIFWAIGDDQVCAVATADFIRNRDIEYNEVLIQEFPYRDASPESVGIWKPLIEELVDNTLKKYLEYDGLVHVYPQWLPKDISLTMGREVYEDMKEHFDHVIMYADHTMEMIPKNQSQTMV